MRQSRRGLKVHEENPFLAEAFAEVRVGRTRTTVGRGKHVTDDGEEVSHSEIVKVRKVDKDQFVKVYARSLKEVFSLTPSAMRIIGYLMFEMQKVKGAVGVHLNWFSADKFFSGTDVKMSRASFNKGMRELLDKDFIAESESPSLYWFNPAVFFNGDRFRVITEYRKMESGSRNEPLAMVDGSHED